ncbi:hypothetical protein JTB14_037364 [Gonioctena quinquepunctata]|nr:hypothetical protein JTB14_037364 [Gonioctena quinquepunctata]
MFFRFLTCWVLFECYLLGAEAANQTVTPTNGWDDILPLHKFGNKSYYLGNTFKATYLQAAQFCNDVHMDLVSVESKEENTFLYDLIQKDGGDDQFWTSGTRLIDGKNFIWLGTAKPIEYTNWQQGEPSNINEKCLEFLLVRNKDLYWNDRDCTAQLYFVCEKEDKKQQKENEKNWPVWEPVTTSHE